MARKKKPTNQSMNPEERVSKKGPVSRDTASRDSASRGTASKGSPSRPAAGGRATSTGHARPGRDTLANRKPRSDREQPADHGPRVDREARSKREQGDRPDRERGKVQPGQ